MRRVLLYLILTMQFSFAQGNEIEEKLAAVISERKITPTSISINDLFKYFKDLAILRDEILKSTKLSPEAKYNALNHLILSLSVRSKLYISRPEVQKQMDPYELFSIKEELWKWSRRIEMETGFKYAARNREFILEYVQKLEGHYNSFFENGEPELRFLNTINRNSRKPVQNLFLTLGFEADNYLKSERVPTSSQSHLPEKVLLFLSRALDRLEQGQVKTSPQSIRAPSAYRSSILEAAATILAHEAERYLPLSATERFNNDEPTQDKWSETFFSTLKKLSQQSQDLPLVASKIDMLLKRVMALSTPSTSSGFIHQNAKIELETHGSQSKAGFWCRMFGKAKPK